MNTPPNPNVANDRPEYPIPGVGILIMRQTVRGQEVLLGERQGSHGTGEFGGPGGKVEFGDTIEETVLKEIEEECGPDLKITDLQMLCVSDLMDYLPEKHFVDIGFTATYVSGEARVTEPDKLVAWNWYQVDDLPAPLFGCCENYFEALRTGQYYFPAS